MNISEDPLHLYYKKDLKKKNYKTYSTYLVLDSFEKNESESDNNKGIYKYYLDNISKKTSNNNIGVNKHLKNIIEIDLMEFCMPMLPIEKRPIDLTTKYPFLKDYININSYTDVDYAGSSEINIGNNFTETKATQLINMGKIHIGIKELQSQSISNFSGFQHIEYNTYLKIYPYPYLYCKPLEGFENIKLHTPLNNLDTLTLMFSNPDKSLVLPKDIISVTPKLLSLDDGVSEAVSTLRLYLDYTEDLEKELLLSSGDRVYFRDFNSYEKKKLNNGSYLMTYVPFLDNYMNNKEQGIYIDISNNKIFPDPNIDFQSLIPAVEYNVIVPHWLDSSNNQLYYLPTDSTSSGINAYNKLKKKFNMYIPRNRIRIPLRIKGLLSYDNSST